MTFEQIFKFLAKIFIVFLLFKSFYVSASDSPCITGWTYLKSIGKCFKIFRVKTDVENATTQCRALHPEYTSNGLEINLLQIKNKLELEEILNMLLRSKNNEIQWIDAIYSTASESWKRRITDLPFDVSHLNVSNAHESSKCLGLWFDMTYYNAIVKIKSFAKREDCSSLHSFICEHKTITCDIDKISGYDSRTMIIYPPIASVNNLNKMQCKPGFFRDYEINNPIANSTDSVGNLSPFYLNCTGKRDISGNPVKYQVSWSISAKTPSDKSCKAIECDPYAKKLKNVKSQPKFTPKEKYLFGEKHSAECKDGYVNYMNRNSNIGSMECKQDYENLRLGMWWPENFEPCIPIRCNFTQMIRVPKNVYLTKAKNRLTDKNYNQFQLSEYTLFENIITYQCVDGTFFPDRKVEKEIICQMKPGSKTEGQWKGYMGTILPLPDNCEPITCQYENVILTPDKNIEEKFHVRYNDTYEETLTRHSKNPYLFGSVITFTCKKGFQTAVEAANMNLTCENAGDWSPRLTKCIKKTDQLVLSGKKKRYLPPPTEANEASNIGTVVIVILFFFILFIVLLDLTTINKELEIMKFNIRHRNYILKKRNDKKK